MYAGWEEAPGAEAARRARRVDGRAFALVSGLLAVVLSLVLLSWSAGGEEDTAGGGVADDVGAPHGGPSGSSSGTTLPGVPEKPVRPSGQAALVDNPLYGTGRLTPRPCPVPELDVDVPASVEDFLHTVADCLDDAWSTQFQRAGIPFEPPDRVFWTEPGVSPCRPYPSQAGAFYCRASTSVYIGVSDVVEKWNGTEDGVVYASLLAHEYAHHVQGESGLLEYYHEQRELEADVLDRNAWTRRSELQANCLAGVFLGSVRVTYPLDGTDLEILLADARATSDREGGPEEDRTHGSAANSERWMLTGWREQAPGACNTWELEDSPLLE